MDNILEKYNNIFNSAIFYMCVCVCVCVCVYTIQL